MAKIDRLFAEMHRQGASDLHMSVGFPPMFRQRGEVVPLQMKPFNNITLQTLLYEIMTPEQVKTFEDQLDLDFSYEVENVARFRANIFSDYRGIGAVFRIIPTEIIPLETLGTPPAVEELCKLESGMVLVTGPTGSGKSTTLAAMIDYINKNREAHIISIEDPIEFVHSPKKCLITQREVHFHTRSFAAALKAACREDPDVVLVGEMRDQETIGLALSAAELGILVFGTLHTNNAGKTIDRVIDVFPTEAQSQARAMLSQSLKGVVAQLLVPRADGSGRVAAMEVLKGGPALANLIREGKTTLVASLIQTGQKEGMISMDKSLLALVKDGVISKEEALHRATDKKMFGGM